MCQQGQEPGMGTGLLQGGRGPAFIIPLVSALGVFVHDTPGVKPVLSYTGQPMAIGSGGPGSGGTWSRGGSAALGTGLRTGPVDGGSSAGGGGSGAAHTAGTMKREIHCAGSPWDVPGHLQAVPCLKGDALRASCFHARKGEVSSESGQREPRAQESSG